MPPSCRLIHIILLALLLAFAQIALAELRCRNLDGIPPGDPNPGDPTDQIHKLRIGMKLEPGTTVIMGGLVDGDQSATIQTAPLGENALIIPTCDQKTFIYKWYTEQRFKANSFPTFARQCNYTNDPVADQPGADQTIRVLRQEPYVDWDRNMNTLKMDCNTIQQSAFLVLPEYYTLTQSSMLTPRVGPYGYEKGDARDPNAFLWPINDRISRIFTVYEYPKEEGWQKLFPINKRVCIARGQIPFEQIPTVNVTSSEVILQLVNAEKNGRDEFSAGISCRTVDPGANICAPAVGGRAAMSTVSVEAIGNFRMRALKKGSTTQIIDSRGTHFTTKFDVSCGTDVQMLFDWFHPATRLPSSGQAWDDSIIPMRRTMCTYSGWSAEGTSRIRLGGPTSNEQADLESSSSAWNNHNLAPMEWFSCKDIPVAEAGGSKNGVSFVALLPPSKSHGQSEGRNTVRRVRRRSDVLV